MHPEPPISASVTPWRVLLVDDEPAIHEVSRLILAGLRFEGRVVELLRADSSAQARELLARHRDVALVLLDVVMETDDAGLALVQHIRDQLGDGDMQIVLRTGQPGMAPERDVVLRYEINGYFLKTDITAQRLHSIVISALRNYRHASALHARPSRVVRAEPLLPGDPDDTGESLRRLAVELAQASQDGAVLLQAQPEVALASNQVTGIELVPLWKTASGLVPADQVSHALHDGVARSRVVQWLLDHACSWARSWQAVRSVPITVSVPLVADSLSDARALQDALDTVRRSGLAPGTLDLLVSEATLLGGRGDMQAALAALRAAGVTFTLTDFGAQTIALQRLSQLAPDRLKLHRLFVRGVVADPQRMVLARSLLALAQTLNISAIADGISSDSDAQFFRWEGCELGQGDALAPGCAPAEVAEFLQNGCRAPH